LLLKGDVLYESKDYKAADKAFRTAAQKNCSQKGRAWLMAGYAAWQYNDFVAGRSAFKQAAQYKRHRKDALAAIAQLNKRIRM
jgi:Tfp pilus assembly protein PilF